MVTGSRLEKEPIRIGGGGNQKWLGGDGWRGTVWEEAPAPSPMWGRGDRGRLPPESWPGLSVDLCLSLEETARCFCGV